MLTVIKEIAGLNTGTSRGCLTSMFPILPPKNKKPNGPGRLAAKRTHDHSVKIRFANRPMDGPIIPHENHDVPNPSDRYRMAIG
jgi:hypothetical protein